MNYNKISLIERLNMFLYVENYDNFSDFLHIFDKISGCKSGLELSLFFLVDPQHRMRGKKFVQIEWPNSAASFSKKVFFCLAKNIDSGKPNCLLILTSLSNDQWRECFRIKQQPWCLKSINLNSDADSELIKYLFFLTPYCTII